MIESPGLWSHYGLHVEAAWGIRTSGQTMVQPEQTPQPSNHSLAQLVAPDEALALRFFTGKRAQEGLLPHVLQLLSSPTTHSVVQGLANVYVNSPTSTFLDFTLGDGAWPGLVEHLLERQGPLATEAIRCGEFNSKVMSDKRIRAALANRPDHLAKMALIGCLVGHVAEIPVPTTLEHQQALAVARFVGVSHLEQADPLGRERLFTLLTQLYGPVVQGLTTAPLGAEEQVRLGQFLATLAVYGYRCDHPGNFQTTIVQALRVFQRAERHFVPGSYESYRTALELAKVHALLMNWDEVRERTLQICVELTGPHAPAGDPERWRNLRKAATTLGLQNELSFLEENTRRATNASEAASLNTIFMTLNLEINQGAPLVHQHQAIYREIGTRLNKLIDSVDRLWPPSATDRERKTYDLRVTMLARLLNQLLRNLV